MKRTYKVLLLRALLLILLAGLLVPVKIGVDDGGTVIYDALPYDVTRRHTMRGDVMGYEEGTVVCVLGRTVYDDTLRKTGAFGDADKITGVTFSVSGGRGPCEVPAEDLTEIRNWLGSFRALKVVDDGKTLPGMEYFTLTVTYENGMTYMGPLGVMKLNGGKYYIWGDPIPDAFYRTFGIDSEE